jgi:hypothetical protein
MIMLSKNFQLKNLGELSLAEIPIAKEKGDDLRKRILSLILHKNKKLMKINGER